MGAVIIILSVISPHSSSDGGPSEGTFFLSAKYSHFSVIHHSVWAGIASEVSRIISIVSYKEREKKICASDTFI